VWGILTALALPPIIVHLTRPVAPQGFSLRQLQHLVLDEADRILSLDFEEELDQILKVRQTCGRRPLAPGLLTARINEQVIPRERSTQLYSATMTSKVQKLQRACLRNPVKVEMASKYQTVSTLRQQARCMAWPWQTRALCDWLAVCSTCLCQPSTRIATWSTSSWSCPAARP
jgi:hypothetical protein